MTTSSTSPKTTLLKLVEGGWSWTQAIISNNKNLASQIVHKCPLIKKSKWKEKFYSFNSQVLQFANPEVFCTHCFSISGFSNCQLITAIHSCKNISLTLLCNYYLFTCHFWHNVRRCHKSQRDRPSYIAWWVRGCLHDGEVKKSQNSFYLPTLSHNSL